MPRFALALAASLLASASGFGQDAPPAFKLRWFGLSMFQLETPGGKKIVFDPHAVPEFGRAIVQADIVVCSHPHSDHTQLDAVENAKAARVFQGVEPGKKGRPAEWKAVDEKVGPIRVRTVGLYHDAEDGLLRGKNSAFIIEADGVTFCHLGDLGHDLTPAQVKAIGKVDVLMVPVGGIYTINGGGAKRAVAAIQPARFVLPMHYGVPGYDELVGPDEFLDGTSNVSKRPGTNELVVPVEAPPGATPPGPVTVVLGWGKK